MCRIRARFKREICRLNKKQTDEAKINNGIIFPTVKIFVIIADCLTPTKLTTVMTKTIN